MRYDLKIFTIFKKSKKAASTELVDGLAKVTNGASTHLSRFLRQKLKLYF